MKKNLLLIMAVASLSAWAQQPASAPVEINIPEATLQSTSTLESMESNPVEVSYDITTRGATVNGDRSVYYQKNFPFYIGNSNKFYGYSLNTTYGIMPLYTETEFVNYSNAAAGDSYLWTTEYYSGGWLAFEPSQDTRNMVIFPTTARQHKTPTLTMGDLSYNLFNNRISTSTSTYASEMACYKLSQFTSWVEDPTKGYYGLAPFNFLELGRRNPGASGEAAYGVYWSDINICNTVSGPSALTQVKKFNSSATKGYVTAVAQHIPAAPAGYSFDRFYAVVAVADSIKGDECEAKSAYKGIPAGTKHTATIYKYIPNGSTFSLEKIGEGTSIVETDLAPGNNSSYYMINFNAVTVDPITGLSSVGVVVPRGTEILIAFESTNDNALGALPLLYANNDADLKTTHPNNLYYRIEGDNVKEWIANPWKPGGVTVTPANMALWVDMVFDFLYQVTFDDNMIEIPVAGGSQKAYVQSLYDYEDWYIEEDEDYDGSAGTIDGWLKYEVSQEEGKCPNVLFTASALPSGVKGRGATMTIESYAEKTTLYINQGETGVDNVKVEAVTVKTVNGNFEVVVPESVNNVTVYNISGQAVANVPVTAGANTIDGSALANGVYVLKFNNGYTVKAVK